MNPRTAFLVVILAFGTLLLQAGCRDSQPMSPPADASRFLVMNWNVYVGADLNSLASVTSAAQVPLAVAQLWQAIARSDPAARMQKIAERIALDRPHLVALQEVALFRRQVPGDAIVGGEQPATAVAIDYLAVLLEALQQRGASYRVAAKTITSDIEAPSFTGGLFTEDLRLTDHEVILARHDVATTQEQEVTYVHNAVLGDGDVQVTVVRGWASVVVQWNEQPVRFVSTHLQTEDVPTVQVQQVTELIAELSDDPRMVVVVGDLNSRADDSTTETIQLLRDAGFRDVWQETRPAQLGATCCQDADLRNAESKLYQRIDYILVRPPQVAMPPLLQWNSRLLGVERTDRVPGGLWSSDHAGLEAAWQLAPLP